MKITKQQLKQMIKEEFETSFVENTITEQSMNIDAVATKALQPAADLMNIIAQLEGMDSESSEFIDKSSEILIDIHNKAEKVVELIKAFYAGGDAR